MNRIWLRQVPLLLIFVFCLPLRWAEAENNAASGRPELLVYCGITMVRPVTEIARLMEKGKNIKVTISQGGSEDLYQSLRKSRKGDLYLPGEPTYRTKYLHEGLLGEYVTVAYNQLALVVAKGNPLKVTGDLRQLLRRDLRVVIGSGESGSVGQASRSVLEKQGFYRSAIQNAVFLAPDSRSLNIALKKGEADLALNWRATAFFPHNRSVLDVLDLEPRIARREPILMILLTFSRQRELAREFMMLAASPQGQTIFRSYGFHVPPSRTR